MVTPLLHCADHHPTSAETLAAFHRQCVENTTGEARAYHEVAARRYAEDAERITREIVAT
jgi:hypothetical protein